MSDVPIAQPISGPGTVIADDTPCVICGYNLRGLIVEGRCPECGSPINRSIHGNLLRYADAQWLRKLLLGIRLMLWNILIGLVVGLLGGIATVLGAPMVVVGGLAIIMSGLEVITALLITVQEPRISLSEDTVTWRKVIRVCAGIALAGQVLQQFRITLGMAHWLTIAGMAMGLASVVAYFGKLLYLGRFALRVPDPGLARSTRIVMWGYAISTAAALLTGLLAIFWMAPAMRTAMMAGPTTATTGPAVVSAGFAAQSSGVSFTTTTGPTGGPFSVTSPIGGTVPGLGSVAGLIGLGAAGCIGGIGGLVFGIWYLVLLFRYRNVFRDALTYVRGYAAAVRPPDSPV